LTGPAPTIDAAAGRPSLGRLNPLRGTALLVAVAIAAWIVTAARMRGMDAGPGTDLGALGWYVGIWVTMMAAMMLPSAAPMVMVYARVSTDRARRGRQATSTWVFVTGYLVAWTGYGLVAYGLARGIAALEPKFLSWDAHGPLVAGGAIVLAGVYELTPLKRICLRHCRSPLHFVLHGWREGGLGALRMGLEHGAYCVGCCWGLMLILFALGVMSLLWMAVVAGLIFLEKVLPLGEVSARVFAVAFVALGIWVAAAPASVPGLTQPNSASAEQIRMRMMDMAPATQPPPTGRERPAGMDSPGGSMMR